MQKPIVVYIGHQLGKEEATRRIKGGISRLAGGIGGQFLMSETKWTDNHLDFRASLLGQSAFGALVPALSAVLAIPLLEEGPTASGRGASF